jgi:hypothetical protein
MHAPTASIAVPSFVSRDRDAAPQHGSAARVSLTVDTIGHRVARRACMGRVQSVFARACNIVCGPTWLTLCTHEAGNGPTVLRLARGARHDLRMLFTAGERVDADRHGLRSARAVVMLRGARVWCPEESAVALRPAACIHANLRRADACLARHRAFGTSVLEREAAPVAAALAQACHALDGEQVERHAGRLVGWGEGLTPAGDDFLIGLIAGLDASACGDEQRLRLRQTLAVVLETGGPRTTPIAAHYLCMAAAGHYNEPLLHLRQALLCEPDTAAIDAAMQRALAVGATSGADTACGLLAGLRVWVEAA